MRERTLDFVSLGIIVGLAANLGTVIHVAIRIDRRITRLEVQMELIFDRVQHLPRPGDYFDVER